MQAVSKKLEKLDLLGALKVERLQLGPIALRQRDQVGGRIGVIWIHGGTKKKKKKWSKKEMSMAWVDEMEQDFGALQVEAETEVEVVIFTELHDGKLPVIISGKYQTP
jgi:hypothetical protein